MQFIPIQSQFEELKLQLMNIPKLPSLANFQIDKSLQEKQFLQNQSQLNAFIKKNHKSNNYYNQAQEVTGLSLASPPETNRVKFNDSGVDSRIQGKMLEDQMRLRSLQCEHDMEKSRIQDQHNASTFRKKYPYGKENVRITEDVIEKYKINNYLNQSQMLKRFEEEARQRKEQLKMSKRNLHYINLSPDQSFIKQKHHQSQLQPLHYHRSLRKKTSILERQMNKLQEKKRKYKVEVQKSSLSRQKQNKKLDNIETMLKDVRNKLDQNISSMTERENQRDRQLQFGRWVDISRDRLQKLSQLSKQQQSYRKKIPVVVYNQQKSGKNNYFSKVVCPQVESYERKAVIVNQGQFREVLKIYDLNKKRMDQLSQKIAIKENRSVF